MTRRWALACLTVWGLVFAGCSASEAEPCLADTGLRAPRFGEAATAQSLRGVVESQTISSSPLPWGRSVSAVTRVWGGVAAERLVIGQRRFVACPVRPSDPAGTVRYRFVGLELAGVADQLMMSEPAGDEALITLDLNLGEPVVYDVTGFDRFMAWLQTWLWEVSVLVIGVIALSQVVFVIRRRGRERRDYLF